MITFSVKQLRQVVRYLEEKGEKEVSISFMGGENSLCIDLTAQSGYIKIPTTYPGDPNPRSITITRTEDL